MDLRYTFSREKEHSEGFRYVQDRMLRDRDDIMRLFQQEARIYVCGSREFVGAVAGATRGILRRTLGSMKKHLSEEEFEEGFQRQVVDRCATDIFG